MKIIRDDIGNFFEYGLDLQTSTLYMGSIGDAFEYEENGVNFQMAEYVAKCLHILDTKKDNDITIKMNNCGGDEYHGWAIYDSIRNCKHHVTIQAYGYCMSMGSLIMQAGDERLMSPLCTMMIHYGTWEFAGHSMDMKRSSDESARHDKIMEDVYLEQIKKKHPKFTRAKLYEMLKYDTYLTPQQAIQYGLADKIIPYEVHES